MLNNPREGTDPVHLFRAYIHHLVHVPCTSTKPSTCTTICSARARKGAQVRKRKVTGFAGIMPFGNLAKGAAHIGVNREIAHVDRKAGTRPYQRTVSYTRPGHCNYRWSRLDFWGSRRLPQKKYLKARELWLGSKNRTSKETCMRIRGFYWYTDHAYVRYAYNSKVYWRSKGYTAGLWSLSYVPLQ